MDNPIQYVDTIWNCPFVFFKKGCVSKFLKKMYFCPCRLFVTVILANGADPDEMPPNAAFHLGLQCLPKYLFIGIQNENG